MSFTKAELSATDLLKDALLKEWKADYMGWSYQTIMAGPDSGTQHQFTGFKKYFNSTTLLGRRNYVILTYGSLIVLFLGYKMRKPKEISHK